MQDLNGKIAVITGGAAGMGRALARQLIAEGAHVATCDIIEENLAETLALCKAEAPQGVRISTHLCDVTDEDQIKALRDSVRAEHNCDHINLLFNNAGIGGGGSFVNATREEWERTFNICWNGVYLMTRTFLPMLLNSTEGHVVNTSSLNGFRASLGGNIPHTAYSSAKFAVKGFTEALINDFRFNAPHLKASIVMPGYVRTEIASNTDRILGQKNAAVPNDDEIGAIQEVLVGLTSEEAAAIILDGVKADEWRILVGPDAIAMDRAVRESPREAYDLDFSDKVWASMQG